MDGIAVNGPITYYEVLSKSFIMVKISGQNFWKILSDGHQMSQSKTISFKNVDFHVKSG